MGRATRDPEHGNKMRIWTYLFVLAMITSSVMLHRDSIGNNNRSGRQNRRNNRRNQSGNGRGCRGGYQPNHRYQGNDFLVSWRVGCSKFTQSEGEAFCRANGMQAISLGSSAKEREFLGLLAKDRQRYFWTGGKVNGRNISWPS